VIFSDSENNQNLFGKKLKKRKKEKSVKCRFLGRKRLLNRNSKKETGNLRFFLKKFNSRRNFKKMNIIYINLTTLI